MNKTFFLPLILLFFIIYFLVFPVGSGGEVFWKATDLYDLGNLERIQVNLDEPLIVNQGRYQGVLADGTGNSFIEDQGGSRAYSLSRRFRKSGSSFLIENLKTHGVVSPSLKGYPLVLGHHVYSVDFGSAYIEEIDDSGQSLWRWQGVSPVTAITAGDGLTVFGSIDGYVRFFSSSGDMTELNMESGSPNQIIYGLALSGDGSTLAVVSGLNEQFVRQFKLSKDSPPVMIHEARLADRFREPVKLLYSGDGSYLWVEQAKSIQQFLNGEINQTIDLEGTFLTHYLDDQEGIYYILTRMNTGSAPRYQLAAHTLNGSVLMKTRFDEYPEFFDTSGSRLFMSMDGKMAVLDREES